MTQDEPINTPSLAGWVIAAAAGLFVFATSHVAMQLSFMGAAFVAALVFAVVGLILGLLHRAAPLAPVHVTRPAPVVAPAAPGTVAVAAPVVAPLAPAVSAVAAQATESRPPALAAPRGGVADDLKKIEGIGPAMEKLCHDLGIFHFDQIAGWGAAEVAWMDGNLKGFKGRVTRDRWVAQARLIGTVGMDEFLRRAKTNDY